MIYKDLFKIIIDGIEYTKNNKNTFTLQELRDIWLEHEYHTFGHKFEIKYDPILVEDILSEEEMRGE